MRFQVPVQLLHNAPSILTAKKKDRTSNSQMSMSKDGFVFTSLKLLSDPKIIMIFSSKSYICRFSPAYDLKLERRIY